MRAPIFLLLLALLTAGCLSAPAPGAPTNQTPRGGTATPQTTPTAPASTTTPPATSTPEPPPPQGGMLVRPAHGENSSRAFTLIGDEDASGFLPPGDDTFRFVGRNDGAAAKVEFDPCGGGNPKPHLEDANGTTLATQPPMMHCMAAVGFVPFPAGGTVYANWTWNGTVYDGDTPRQAAAGVYYVRGDFIAQRDGETISLTVRIPVNLLDRDSRAIR